MPRTSPPVVLTGDQEQQLEKLVHAPSTPQSDALRARAILLHVKGLNLKTVAAELRVSRQSVTEWRDRFVSGGVPELLMMRSGRGRKPSVTKEKAQQIVDATLHTKPLGETQWSCRTMAKAQGVSKDTVQRIWDAHNLQPHRVKTFKLSRDKKFVEKLTDVVGLYLNPPDKAIVLCVDEKSQVQALDRTQPGLPLKKGRCGTMTHDYKRNGTTTLFAALNMLDGSVISQCMPRHRHQEFLKFLRKMDKEFPASIDLHLIVDNYGTHKHPKVLQWLQKHPRFVLHFIPTSSSWVNMIERWFREITQKRLRRGVFRSVPELIAAIEEYVAVHNKEPKPFVWSATVDNIMGKIRQCQSIYETLH